MSVFYRAIWNDNRASLADGAMIDFAEWVKGKSAGSIQVPPQGTVTATVRPTRDRSDDYDVEVRVDRAAGPESSPVDEVVRSTYVEMRPDGSRWTTVLRTWTCRQPEDEERQEGAGWVWVDVEAVSDGSLDDVVIAAPRLVPALLRSGSGPHRRCVSLAAEPVPYNGVAGAERLAEMLGHTDRDMPVVVFLSHDLSPLPGMPTWGNVVSRAARSLAGMTSIATVDEAAAAALESILGKPYGLRAGSLRTYLPQLDPATRRDDWRHREIPWTRFERQVATAANLLTRTLGPRAASRRAPRSYDSARDLLERASRADSGALLQRLHEAEAENRQQRERLAVADDRYVDLLVDYEGVQSESATLRDQVRVARSEREVLLALVRREGLEERYWTQAPALQSVKEIPARASSPWNAAAQAQQFLGEYLSLPDEACKELDVLDGAVESAAWGQTAWEGFCALFAYAEHLATGSGAGSFWTWCEKSQNPLAWRATPKKLAMTESESLKNNKKLWAKRLLPVSTDVDPQGYVHMEAHLKIAEGGGPLAPRIYFLHSLSTGKVHVGFFGPHKLMPNSLT